MNKKYKKVIICCEHLNFINDALSIKWFFENRFNINTELNLINLGDKCIINNYSNSLLICLTNELTILNKGGTVGSSIRHYKSKSLEKALTIVQRKRYDSKNAHNHFSYGCLLVDDNNMVLDVGLISRRGYHSLFVVIHELLHLRRKNKECSNKGCIGYGLGHEKKSSLPRLCDKCFKLFNEIMDKFFEKKEIK